MGAGNLSSGSPKYLKRNSSEVDHHNALGIVFTSSTVLAVAIMNSAEKEDWCGEIACMVISMLCGLMAMVFGLMILDSTKEFDELESAENLNETPIAVASSFKADADGGNKSPIIPLFSVLSEKMVDDDNRKPMGYKLSKINESVTVSNKWQDHLNSLKEIKVPTPAVPKQLLPKKDVGAVIDENEPPRDNENITSKPSDVTFESFLFPTIDDDKVAKGATVGNTSPIIPLYSVLLEKMIDGDNRKPLGYHLSKLNESVTASKKWQADLNPLERIKVPTQAVPKQLLPKKDAGDVIDENEPPRDDGNMTSKPSNVTFESFLTAAFPAIDDDKVAKGAIAGTIGFIKEIKTHGKRLSLVVKSKRKSKHIDLRHRKIVSAEGAAKVVRSVFVRQDITLKGGKSFESEKLLELEKLSSCPVTECEKKSKIFESRRKHNKTIKIPSVVLAQGYAKVVEPTLDRPNLTSKVGKRIESGKHQAKCFVDCKEKSKNIDSRRREVVGTDKRKSENIVPAQSVVRSSFVRPTLIHKDDKLIELDTRHKGHEKRSTPLVEESRRKSENMDPVRKNVRKIPPGRNPPIIDTKAAGIKPSLRKPPIPSARKPARHAESLADSRKTTSNIPGPAAASTATQRSRTTVMPRWK